MCFITIFDVYVDFMFCKLKKIIIKLYPILTSVPNISPWLSGRRKVFRGQNWILILILSSVKLRSEESPVCCSLTAPVEALESWREGFTHKQIYMQSWHKLCGEKIQRKSLCLLPRSRRRYRDDRTKRELHETEGTKVKTSVTLKSEQSQTISCQRDFHC